MEPIVEKKLIQDCDSVIFASVESDEDVRTTMHFFKGKKDTVKPTDIWFKYNILLWKTHDETETFSAILGDPRGYVERVGRLGYHGMLYKKSAKSSKEFKNVISGNGPCNKERLASRNESHKNGEWVRAAAMAYAKKHKEAMAA